MSESKNSVTSSGFADLIKKYESEMVGMVGQPYGIKKYESKLAADLTKKYESELVGQLYGMEHDEPFNRAKRRERARYLREEREEREERRVADLRRKNLLWRREPDPSVGF